MNGHPWQQGFRSQAQGQVVIKHGVGVLLAMLTVTLVPAPANARAQSQTSSTRPDVAPTGDAANGKRMFANHGCDSCHGTEGQGAVGPRIGPPSTPLSAFTSFVRQPTGQMPSFKSQDISDSDLRDIYTFLKSVAPSSQTDAPSSGNAENGKRLFVKYGCYECHGFQGQGSPGTGARLAPDPIPLAALMSYVRKPAGEMPPYSSKVVSDQDLADIHAFLRSQPHAPDVKSIPLLK
jgi:mono/diheme cytochrome c family protein